jgi:hypothetical protein
MSSLTITLLKLRLSDDDVIELTSILMSAPIYLLECALADLYVQVSLSGQITLADRYGLMAALFADALDEEERCAVDRILYAVCKGRLKMSDEISTLAC